jgi:serine/threonine-protein kinase
MISEPQPGQVVDRRFAILELIGRGGMGSVFKAKDLSSGRSVALKFPFFELESNPAFYSRFERELQIGAALDHPGILKILPVDHPSRPYVAMEFLEGETIWDLLQRVHPLPVADAFRLALPICDALEYMHAKQVVHRDLKPTNIMICHDGSVRLMDFGIAMSGQTRRLTLAGFTGRMGTAHYMAPEQVKGQRGDARTDIYGFGAILYEMTTGHAPYDGEPDLYSVMNARLAGDPVAPRVHNPALCPEVEEIILHAMERDPRNRYQTIRDMRADLVEPGRVQVTGRAARLKVPTFGARRWRIAGGIALAFAVPVVLFFLFLLVLKR